MFGGLHQNGEKDKGLAVLSTKAAFNAYMVGYALALLLSTSSLFFYFLEAMNDDPHQVSINCSQVSKLYAVSTVLNICGFLFIRKLFLSINNFVSLSNITFFLSCLLKNLAKLNGYAK